MNYYCEQCRVKKNLTKGIAARLHVCEVCKQEVVCHVVTNKEEQKRNSIMEQVIATETKHGSICVTKGKTYRVLHHATEPSILNDINNILYLSDHKDYLVEQKVKTTITKKDIASKIDSDRCIHDSTVKGVRQKTLYHNAYTNTYTIYDKDNSCVFANSCIDTVIRRYNSL